MPDSDFKLKLFGVLIAAGGCVILFTPSRESSPDENAVLAGALVLAVGVGLTIRPIRRWVQRAWETALGTRVGSGEPEDVPAVEERARATELEHDSGRAAE